VPKSHPSPQPLTPRFPHSTFYRLQLYDKGLIFIQILS
jgi:hypothetical protein